jgi:SAM-dependent methyltransferase
MDADRLRQIVDAPPAPLKEALKRLAVGYYQAFRSGRTFALNGHEYRYFYHPYNLAWRNERTVEVPLARDRLLSNHGKAILEVGNVLSHYGESGHEILDRYEEAPGVINEDAVDFQPGRRYDLILSISTLEHIGWDETPRRPARVLAAIDNLRNLLAPGGELFATAPLGYNPEFDSFLRKGELPFDAMYALERIGRTNTWRQKEPDSVLGASYKMSSFRAHAIIVGSIKEGQVRST